MNKMHQKFVVPKKKQISNLPISIQEYRLSIPEKIKSGSEENKEHLEEVKNILQTYNDFISSANSIETIREELDEYKKVTDQRIEKLVNLFLSIK